MISSSLICNSTASACGLN
uniref:Uncharacterized protein n=1 Tax=Arundo donax TaxID=35708 RepID=A0A0A9AS08_ARUDO